VFNPQTLNSMADQGQDAPSEERPGLAGPEDALHQQTSFMGTMSQDALNARFYNEQGRPMSSSSSSTSNVRRLNRGQPTR
jgi:hypothetical protein